MSDKNGLYGLILTGGKSSRMGQAKSDIVYHQLPQREHLRNLLKPYCEQIYLSVKSESQNPEHISDQFEIESPINGIVSAFEKYPDHAWIVVGCDLPNIDNSLINHLLAHRNSKYVFNGYLDSDKDKPEPMIGIWEPKAHSQLIEFIKNGGFSPREFIMSTDSNLTVIPDTKHLVNINTLEELRVFKNTHT